MDLEELVIVDNDSSMSVESSHPRSPQPMSASEDYLATQRIAHSQAVRNLAALTNHNQRCEGSEQQSTLLTHSATTTMDSSRNRQSKHLSPVALDFMERQLAKPSTPSCPMEMVHRAANGFLEHKHSTTTPPVRYNLVLSSIGN